MTAILLRCKCKNGFMDATYGSGIRVHNTMKSAPGTIMARCASCRNERDGHEHADAPIVSKASKIKIDKTKKKGT